MKALRCIFKSLFYFLVIVLSLVIFISIALNLFLSLHQWEPTGAITLQNDFDKALHILQIATINSSGQELVLGNNLTIEPSALRGVQYDKRYVEFAVKDWQSNVPLIISFKSSKDGSIVQRQIDLNFTKNAYDSYRLIFSGYDDINPTHRVSSSLDTFLFLSNNSPLKEN